MSSAIRHKGVQLIVGGWTFFIGENLLLSENRDYLVEELGEKTYRNIYGCLSTLACGSVCNKTIVWPILILLYSAVTRSSLCLASLR